MAARKRDSGVTVSYVDTASPSAVQQATADWCICTIPLPILSQLPLDVGGPMKNAIDSLPYAASVKVGLQFKRRFWEEDEAIYGGISYTDLPIREIGYPNYGSNRGGRGVLLAAYLYEGANSFEFTAKTPAERVASAVEFGAKIHPQYKSEFENGVRWPGIGCRSRSAAPVNGPKPGGHERVGAVVDIQQAALCAFVQYAFTFSSSGAIPR